MKTINKLWIGLIILAVLTPLGLLLPAYFKSGDAWGEWGADGIKELVGYVPAGLEKLSNLWKAPMPDYAFQGSESRSLAHLSFSYLISAFFGVLVCVGIIFLLGKFLKKKE